MTIADVLAPAVDLARGGYPITPRVSLDIGSQLDAISRDPTARDTFLIDGAVPAVGDTQRQPARADTLEAIGREGPDAFYRGPAAVDMVEYLNSLGGLHTIDDFAATRGEYVRPIRTTYRGHDVYEIPPNGQGIIALLILNILSRFTPSSNPFDAGDLHVLVEATRLAYAARDTHVADCGMADQVEMMLSQSFADRLAALIDRSRAGAPTAHAEAVEHKDTVFISVVDRDRNAVSFINSIFYAYGSGLMSPASGVLFHNRGQSFSLVPGHPNAVGPRKRPMHTIIPGMVAKDGRVTMSFGVMGGHYQAMGHAHFLSRLIDHGLDLQEAIDQPRLFPLPGSLSIEAESLIRARLGDELERRGFIIKPAPRPIGGIQAIAIDWDRGVLLGASDHRKDGMALGW
jgi:gamma-glutamyltranspeptidase/glutathione hydrolase